MRVMMAIVLGGLAAPLAAQQRAPDPEVLRAQVAQRFITAYVQQAGLTEEQHRRFHTLALAAWEHRMATDRRRQALFQALERQMRPGVAADQDSVARLLEGLLQLEAERQARAEADMRRYLEFLTPVQAAQLLMMMTRFERQIDQIMRQRMEGHMMERPRRNPPPR